MPVQRVASFFYASPSSLFSFARLKNSAFASPSSLFPTEDPPNNWIYANNHKLCRSNVRCANLSESKQASPVALYHHVLPECSFHSMSSLRNERRSGVAPQHDAGICLCIFFASMSAIDSNWSRSDTCLYVISYIGYPIDLSALIRERSRLYFSGERWSYSPWYSHPSPIVGQ